MKDDFPREFELPPDRDLKSTRELIQSHFTVSFLGEYRQTTFYDTFDWRLFKRGFELELSDGSGIAVFRSRGGDFELRQAIEGDLPANVSHLPRGAVRQRILPMAGIRHILPFATVSGQVFWFAALDDAQKTVCRLSLQELRFDGETDKTIKCLRIHPLRGWENEARKLSKRLLHEGFAPASNSLAEQARIHSGRHPDSFPRRYPAPIQSRTPVARVAKSILGNLLEDMRINEAGSIIGTDTEFLHDFRVASRRMRSGLSSYRSVFDEQLVREIEAELKYMGQVTGKKRDLDVFSMDLESQAQPHWRELSQSAPGLVAHIENQRDAAGVVLKKYLKSRQYQSFCKKLEGMLKQPPGGEDAMMPVEDFADRLIWKLYRRIRRLGFRIDKHSHDEDIHTLRKLCKRLRYALDFYGSLYPAHKLNRAQRYLKKLQNVLGLFQDQCVQIEHLQDLAGQPEFADVAADMVASIAGFEQRKLKLRRKFYRIFAEFADKEHHATFRSLFRPGDKA